MSSLIVKVVKFERLNHPHADALFIAVPDGTSWQCCVRHDQFENEDLGIYIPVDSLIPTEMAESLNLINQKEDSPHRVRTIRLRSMLSQGVLLPNNGRFQEGEDVAEVLGITKYVEPEPEDEDLRHFPPEFVKYTNIENIKNYPTVFQDGEEVIMTEKIHGCTFRCGWVDGEFYVGSATTAFKPEVNSKWLDVAHKYNLLEKLKNYPNVILYGELHGPGVQSLHYGLKNSDLCLFDIYVGSEGRYLDYQEFLQWCDEKFDIPTAPLIYQGPYSDSILNEHTIGQTTMIKNGHIREGVIVKPPHERWNFENGLGRVVLKSISPDYLLKRLD